MDQQPPCRAVQRSGACFGFRVQSPLSFHYLREGDGDALEVIPGSEERNPDDPALRLVAEWSPRANRPLQARLFEDGTLYHFWVNGQGWFIIDPQAYRIIIPAGGAELQREERLWGVPAALCFSQRGDVPLHAAAVEVDGSALLLAAPGRFGKTTLAAGFIQAGHRLLSEDVTCVRPASAAVIPGPAMLRVRRDVFNGLSLPGAQIVGETSDRLSLALDVRHRGDCRPVPIGAVVFLRFSADQTTVERVKAAESIPDLWTLSFKIRSEAGWEQSFAGVSDLATRVPLWNLSRPLTLEDLGGTVDTIISSCLKGGAGS